MRKNTLKWFGMALAFIVAGALQAASPLMKLEYFYSKDGMLIGRVVNGARQNYEYDRRGQLLAVKDQSGNDVERYVYDPAGNILSKTINGKTTVFTYDAANQLTSSMADGKTTDYRYDGAGRLVQEGDKTYQYGYLDKILEVQENGSRIAAFDYHVSGQIATAAYTDKTESFQWDGLALIQCNETSYINEPYVTGGNPVLAGDNVLFNDMLGSTLGVKSGDGISAIAMTAFGESGDQNAFFTGKPAIGGLGYVFLFRNYRPDQGKWQSADPLGYPNGWNNLAYVSNRVSLYIDWLGLAGTLIIVGEGGSSGGMFSLAANTYQNANGGTVVNVSTGQDVINAINNYVNTNGSIDSLQIFCHSSGEALFVNQGSSSASLYLNGISGDAGYANVSSIPASAFSNNAGIGLWGCNTNNNPDGMSIAQQIANQTNTTVTGASGPTVFSGVEGGAPGQGLPDPVPANYSGNVYLVPQYSNRGFSSVRPE